LISAFDVESEPPAIITSASPRSIAAAAVVIACKPEAHARVTVIASTDAGKRRSSAISRPTLGAVPGRITPPHTVPSISLREMPVRSSSAPTAPTPRPMVSILMSCPNALTNGVRTPPTITTRRDDDADDDASFFLAMVQVLL
jgi:hypothetical protein